MNNDLPTTFHRMVELRGGPLDGHCMGMGPYEIGHELRISYVTPGDDDQHMVMREVFYDVIGFRGEPGNQREYNRVLVAQYSAQQDTVICRIE